MASKRDGMVLVADVFLEGRAPSELEWDLHSQGVHLGWSPTGRVAQRDREGGTALACPSHLLMAQLPFLGRSWDKTCPHPSETSTVLPQTGTEPALIPVAPAGPALPGTRPGGQGCHLSPCTRCSSSQSPPRETMGCELFSCFLQKLLQGCVLDLAQVLIRLREISPRLYCCAQQTGYIVLDDTSAPLS